jgi:HSP20 family protein
MIRHYSPIVELLKLKQDINRLLSELSGEISGSTLQPTASWIPNVDLSENSKEFIVKVEVPGTNSDHLQIVLQEGYLHISGEKKQDVHNTKVRYLCLERSYGKFDRIIYLNAVADVNSACARLQNGILTIILPKLSNRRRPKKVIPIEAT